jgi:hypothetical protein
MTCLRFSDLWATLLMATLMPLFLSCPACEGPECQEFIEMRRPSIHLSSFKEKSVKLSQISTHSNMNYHHL